MPKPTKEELKKINQFTMRELSEDEVYVFECMAIDDQETSYSSKLHLNLLKKFQKDAQRGVGLLMNHNSRTLPVGRSFDANLKVDMEDGQEIRSLYSKYYIDLGRNTQGGMTTDDLAKGIDAGTIFDTSIGFNATKWDCGVCGHDIRDWQKCHHIPGKTYEIEENGVVRNVKCVVTAGADGSGELLENSLVYAGACNRATIKKNFSIEGDVTNQENSSKLHLIDNFKDVPLTATIFQYFTKDGSVLLTDTPERTNGSQILKQRSEEQVEFAQVKQALSELGIEFDSIETLSNEIKAIQGVSAELSVKDAKITGLEGELSLATEKVVELEGQLSKKDEVISELSKTNEELTEKAGLAETYRQDLVTKALESGVRAQGNAFNSKMFEKFLGTLSIDEIKEVIDGFETEFRTKFEGARTTSPDKSKVEGKLNNEPKSADDFEDETEFRNFVADKAMELSKEKGISFKDALSQVREQFTKEVE